MRKGRKRKPGKQTNAVMPSNDSFQAVIQYIQQSQQFPPNPFKYSSTLTYLIPSTMQVLPR